MLGLIGKKLGMTQVFGEDGNLTPVTAIQIEANIVVGIRSPEKDGYSAVVLGSGVRKKNRLKKPYTGQFPEGKEPCAHTREFRGFEKECKLGDKIGVELFENLSFLDMRGVSKGKGFQGVMKRHGFGGGNKTHGSKFHRQGGSTGMAASPSKVFRGTRMAGRTGGDSKTVQCLRLIRIDREKELVLVKGAVPGRKGGRVIVMKAKKR